MTPIDPSRILNLAKTLESGTTDEKLDLIDELDAGDPIASGVLIRALTDASTDVRYRALQKLEEADVRPPDAVLDDLLADEDEAIRDLADALSDRPETLNPLEKLIPLVEGLADQLGPLGGMLRSMIQTLRGVGAGDERTQLVTVSRLTNDNPAALLVVNQALNSEHISVRLTALRKALELDSVTIPEAAVTPLATDPSADVRNAAEAVIRAGKVANLDEETLRANIMQSFMKSMMGAGGLSGLDLGSILQGFGGAEPERGPEPVLELASHVVDGRIYVVGDSRVRDRLLSSLARQAGYDMLPGYEEIEHATEPARWSLSPTDAEPSSPPGWVEKLAESGLEVDSASVAIAEQARNLSQQVWGAAFADHSGETALTLAFHDGILSRAEWSGERTGAWSVHTGAVDPAADGPQALLTAFLDDPTDDKLTPLGAARELSVVE